LRRLNIYVLGTRGFPSVQGGVEKHCEQLYPRLANIGCSITVFTRTPYIERKNRLKEWNNINFIHLWAPKKKSLEAIIHTLLGVIIAKLGAPHILHIHAIGPSILVPIAKMLGLKVVITNHGPDYKRKKWGFFAKKALKFGELLGTKYADKVIVISKEIKRMIEKRYGREDLIFIPNGVNFPEKTLQRSTLKKYNLEPKKYIFTACRFVPEKGLHDLIAAYKKIGNQEFNLVIAGEADHETEYSRNLKKTSYKIDGVVLTGFISGKPLVELFSNAALFVLPSYYEGLPIALLEAMSYELPVLASDIPQNREIPLPEFRYFKIGNINDLSNKIKELTKKGISEQEKKKQREILEKNYNWNKIAQQTYNVYKNIYRNDYV